MFEPPVSPVTSVLVLAWPFEAPKETARLSDALPPQVAVAPDAFAKLTQADWLFAGVIWAVTITSTVVFVVRVRTGPVVEQSA